MKQISLQDIFDLAWKHFIENDEDPATVKDGGLVFCSYKTEDGRHCAVGLALFSPEFDFPVDKLLAGGSGTSPFSAVVFYYSKYFDESVKSLSTNELDRFQQKLHDDLVDDDGSWINSKDRRRQLYTYVAEEYGLEVPK